MAKKPPPLPKQTAANDRLIASTPYDRLTQRQKDYADMYGVPLQSRVGGGTAPTSGSGVLTPEQIAAIANAPAPGGGTRGNPVRSPANGNVGLDGVPEMGMDGNANAGVGAGSGAGPAESDIPVYGDATGSSGTGGGAVPAPVDPLAEQRKRDKEKADRDAFSRLKGVLADYGLEALAGLVQQWIVDDLSETEILQRMRETDQFKRRFPAIDERRKKGLSPLSPGEYVAYERQAKQVMRAAGIPQGFYDSNEDFTNFLNMDVSLSELTDRIGLASNAAFNSDASVRQAMAQYGMTGGDLTAYFLDPDKAQPLLERKYNSARLSAAGNRAGFGFLDESEATGLLQAGVGEAAAAQGFGELTNQAQLFTPLDMGEDAISREDQLGAAFLGNGNARRRIQQRARRRQSQFEGGGSFAAGDRGIAGLGEND